jgi:hypothetical protein
VSAELIPGPTAEDRKPYNEIVLFFEFFPAFVMIVGAIVATALYFVNRNTPDDRAQREERRLRAEERRQRAKHAPPERGGRRPSMSA